jgi:selenocysteine lyase/cysteine desulfurase
MNIEISRLRNDTRAAARVVHLNNCGASLPPSIVVDAVVSHLKAEEDLGPYEAASVAGERTTALYRAAATSIGCKESEIAFCDSASRAWNVLVYSLRLKAGDRVLVSPLEFGSGLIAVQHAAERAGAKVEVLPADAEGSVILQDLKKVLSGRPPALVAITHAAAHSGSVNPVREIGEMVKTVGSFYLIDACQSLGQMPISVDSFRCDALTATGRKWLRGPRGTGFLYVRNGISELIDPVTSDLVTTDYLIEPDAETCTRLKIRPDARRFELWERSIAAAIGLGVALEYLLELTSINHDIYDRILELAQYAADQLRRVDGVSVWAPSRAQSGVVGFAVRGRAPADVRAACSRDGINISTMSAWDAPLDFSRRKTAMACRIAPHYFNAHEEIDHFLRVIRNLAPG